MNYFNNCNTMDDAKNLFRKLSKELHPDHRPTEEQDQANADFILLYKQYKEFSPTHGRERDETDNADTFYNLFKNFDKLKNVKVSFIGTWIWLEDEEPNATRNQKEIIKSINIDGYFRRWNKTRKVWQFVPVESNYRKFKSKNESIESLKSFFGAKEYKTTGKQQTQIA